MTSFLTDTFSHARTQDLTPETRTWARRITGWVKTGLDVYCYFDNDHSGYAPKNALQLRELLDP